MTTVPFLLAGIGNTIVLIVVFTVYVRVTPSEYLARVIGIHVGVGTAAMVCSFLLSGVLIGALGVHGTFRLEAIGIAGTLILGIFLLRPLINSPERLAADVRAPTPALEEL
jgi:hypothetical protein